MGIELEFDAVALFVFVYIYQFSLVYYSIFVKVERFISKHFNGNPLNYRPFSNFFVILLSKIYRIFCVLEIRYCYYV